MVLGQSKSCQVESRNLRLLDPMAITGSLSFRAGGRRPSAQYPFPLQPAERYRIVMLRGQARKLLSGRYRGIKTTVSRATVHVMDAYRRAAWSGGNRCVPCRRQGSSPVIFDRSRSSGSKMTRSRVPRSLRKQGRTHPPARHRWHCIRDPCATRQRSPRRELAPHVTSLAATAHTLPPSRCRPLRASPM